jgi:putative PIN family toxin of toxin-antitoxin system
VITRDPIRAVFDCNVLLQALANPAGPAGQCMEAVRTGGIRLFVSHALLAELRDVAARPKVGRQLCLSPAGTDAFVDEIMVRGTMIDPVAPVFEHPHDPKDNMVVDLAVAAGAHVITSRDRHLLKLRDARTKVGAEFMSRFGFIEVLTPVDLLARLRTT